MGQKNQYIIEMPYVQVQPGDLVVGQEYVITRIGIEPSAGNNGREFETVNVPIWEQRPGQPPPPTQARTMMKKPAPVIAPPTAEKRLLNAYRAKVTWLRGDGRFSQPYQPSWERHDLPKTVSLDYVRKRAFFAGINAKGLLVFTQERTFGSSKPIAFVPVDVNAKAEGPWPWPKYPGLAPEDYAFWQMSAKNNTRRNKSNLVEGNLLGLNNTPKPAVNTRTAEQALNNAQMEQNLKGLFGGGSRRRTRKY